MPRRSLPVLAVFLCLAAARDASAHREDYSDETLVFLTLGAGEWEPEYWLDLGWQRGGGSFLRHSIALEHGLSERFMVDARASLLRETAGATRLESARLELRRRFLDEGQLPVDVAISAEVNTRRQEDDSRESALEPRLILSKDVGRANMTLNLSEEIPVGAGRALTVVALGLRYNASELLRAGVEVKYETAAREGSAVPQVWIALPHEATLKLAGSVGFDRRRDSFVRMAVEIDL